MKSPVAACFYPAEDASHTEEFTLSKALCKHGFLPQPLGETRAARRRGAPARLAAAWWADGCGPRSSAGSGSARRTTSDAVKPAARALGKRARQSAPLS